MSQAASFPLSKIQTILKLYPTSIFTERWVWPQELDVTHTQKKNFSMPQSLMLCKSTIIIGHLHMDRIKKKKEFLDVGIFNW